jgi:hypothetical protein
LRGAYGVVRRRGSPEAGAIFVKIDWLDDTYDLYAPAPQTAFGESVSDRRFVRVGAERSDSATIEQKLAREVDFDPDLWIIEVEDRKGEHGLSLADD